MDLIDFLLKDHRVLRGSAQALVELLGEAYCTGWDDCKALDPKAFLGSVHRLVSDFNTHERLEDRLLTPLIAQLDGRADMAAVVHEGHRGLEEITRLFEAVANLFDGQHVYRVRTVLTRLREELESHLDFEERRLFPLLRQAVPEPVLEELGRRCQRMLETVPGESHVR